MACARHAALFSSVVLAIVNFGTPYVASAQSTAGFGTCAFWHDQKPAGKNPIEDPLLEMHRIGYSQGFVVGTVGSLPLNGPPPADASWALLRKQWAAGLAEAVNRPAFLVEAFDKKCEDYRNRRVSLSRVGMLIFFEIGGASATKIEQALEVLRTDDGDAAAILRALAKLLPPQ
jgi:hypothetical protein